MTTIKPSHARLGAICGWLTLGGILAFEVIGPQIVAGQRVSGMLDSPAIMAHYQHPALLYFAPGTFITILVFAIFAVTLYTSMSDDPDTRFFATLGLAFSIAQVPLIITKTALEATLVSTANSGVDVMPMFRFWDLLYNSGVYVTEAGFTTAFSLAMWNAPIFPRWVSRFGLLVGLLQLVNLTALFIGIPDTATLPGNLAFMTWFIGASIGLLRQAQQSRQMPVLQDG